MRKGKNFILTIPIYPCAVMISLGQPIDDLIKAVKKWDGLSDQSKLDLISGIDEMDGAPRYGCVHHLRETGYMILQLGCANVRTVEQKATLAHEIFHVTEIIMAHAEVKHSAKSSEAFAYMISYLTTEIFKQL